MNILYNLRRINEVCKEHVENNFLPLPPRYASEYELLTSRIGALFDDTLTLMKSGNIEAISGLRRQCDEIKDSKIPKGVCQAARLRIPQSSGAECSSEVEGIHNGHGF